MQNFRQIELDVSELEAPEPLMRIARELPRVGDRTYLRITHRMRPCKLYDILKQKGLCSKTIEPGEGVIVYVWEDDGGELTLALEAKKE